MAAERETRSRSGRRSFPALEVFKRGEEAEPGRGWAGWGGGDAAGHFLSLGRCRHSLWGLLQKRSPGKGGRPGGGGGVPTTCQALAGLFEFIEFSGPSQGGGVSVKVWTRACPRASKRGFWDLIRGPRHHRWPAFSGTLHQGEVMTGPNFGVDKE